MASGTKLIDGNIFIDYANEKTVSVSTGSAGYVITDTGIPHPTKTGYTFIGWWGRSTSYRVSVIGVAGSDRLVCYVNAASTGTSANIYLYAMFVRTS